MTLIWTSKGHYHRVAYETEADLEAAISQVRSDLFGPGRVYLDVKKRIGGKSGTSNVPDGYLLDLSGGSPRLYVVENELASHDPLRHIAVQILQFSLSFEEEPRTVKTILFGALQEQPEVRSQCEEYAAKHGFRNLDHMLEYMVFEAPFSALVIMDEIPEKLESVLAERFQFGVEVLELSRYENHAKERIYRFEPFLADLGPDIAPAQQPAKGAPTRLDPGEIDTVVVPAHEETFQKTFLGEDRWYAIRIHGAMRPQIKYIAVYRAAPTHAITHIAPVKSIEPWKEEPGKYVVNFAEPARQIDTIKMASEGRVKGLPGLRYTSRSRLEAAKTLDEVW